MFFSSRDEFDPRLFEAGANRRAAAEREEQERAATRVKNLASQSSPHYDPQHRIRIWEHLHAMRLPRDLNHRLVGVIAEQTALSVQQIQHEQQRRAMEAAKAAAPATT